MGSLSRALMGSMPIAKWKGVRETWEGRRMDLCKATGSLCPGLLPRHHTGPHWPQQSAAPLHVGLGLSAVVLSPHRLALQLLVEGPHPVFSQAQPSSGGNSSQGR